MMKVTKRFGKGYSSEAFEGNIVFRGTAYGVSPEVQVGLGFVQAEYVDL